MYPGTTTKAYPDRGNANFIIQTSMGVVDKMHHVQHESNLLLLERGYSTSQKKGS